MANYRPIEEPAQSDAEPQPERKIGYETGHLEQNSTGSPAKSEDKPFLISDWASFRKPV